MTDGPTPPAPGFTVWLLGGSPADQAAVAARLAEALAEAGLLPELLDSPSLAAQLWPEPGREDHDALARRLGRVAGLLARHGAAVVVAGCPAGADTLDALRQELGELVLARLSPAGQAEDSGADLVLEAGDPVVAVGQMLAWLMDTGYLGAPSGGVQEGYTPEEEAQVMRRLAELGYV